MKENNPSVAANEKIARKIVIAPEDVGFRAGSPA
jgi:hypothetical protein